MNGKQLQALPLPPAAAAAAARLRAAIKAGTGFFEPSMTQLRAELAAALKAALFENYTQAQEAAVEQTLWKLVFYRPIEEFRRRIRYAADAGERGKEPLRKAKAAFDKFTTHASAFYKHLVLEVQAVYGDGGCPICFSDEPTVASHRQPATHSAATVDARPTVYRCLICLGDLARYKINADDESGPRDWAPAAAHYRQAAHVLPSGGNAFNQLAVLATYVGDELGAVVHYFRSLCVAQPFLIARENLLLLFEQNRVRYDELTRSRGSRPQPGSRQQRQHPQQSSRKAPLASMTDLITHFVRLHGVLFARINVDSFRGVLAGAMAQLDSVLQSPGTLRALTSISSGSGAFESPMLRLAMMAMAMVHLVDYRPEGTPQGVSEELQRRELRQSAESAALQLTAKVVNTAAMATKAKEAAGRGDDLRVRLLPAAHVLLLWLSGHPDVLRQEGASASQDVEQLQQSAQQLRAWLAHQPALQSQPVNAGSSTSQKAQLLPELLSLRGFQPLGGAMSSNQQSTAPLDRKEDFAVRLAAITSLLDKLQHAGRSAADAAAAQLGVAAAGAMHSRTGVAAAATAQQSDDEEEEVIVYAPRVSSPAAESAAATEQLVDSAAHRPQPSAVEAAAAPHPRVAAPSSSAAPHPQPHSTPHPQWQRSLLAPTSHHPAASDASFVTAASSAAASSASPSEHARGSTLQEAASSAAAQPAAAAAAAWQPASLALAANADPAGGTPQQQHVHDVGGGRGASGCAGGTPPTEVRLFGRDLFAAHRSAGSFGLLEAAGQLPRSGSPVAQLGSGSPFETTGWDTRPAPQPLSSLWAAAASPQSPKAMSQVHKTPRLSQEQLQPHLHPHTSQQWQAPASAATPRQEGDISGQPPPPPAVADWSWLDAHTAALNTPRAATLAGQQHDFAAKDASGGRSNSRLT